MADVGPMMEKAGWYEPPDEAPDHYAECEDVMSEGSLCICDEINEQREID